MSFINRNVLKRSRACALLLPLLLLALLLLPMACNGGAPPLGDESELEISGSDTNGPSEDELLGSDDPQASARFNKPAFYLDSLPELAPFASPREIVNRYYEEEFVDTLKPAKDYGRIYPFEGRFVGANMWESNTYYGLVDEKGRVVVDPVYSYASYETSYQDEEPAYLILHYPVDKDDETAQRLMEESYGDIQRHRIVFAAIDGAWVSGDFYGVWASIHEDRIFVQDYNNIMERHAGNGFYSLYDLQGNLIAESDGTIYSFSEGLGVARHVNIDDNSGHVQEYFNYIDKNGRVVIPGPFSYADRFTDGRAYVTIGEGWDNRQGGIIDTRGNFIEGPGPDDDIRGGFWGDYIQFYDESSGSRLLGLKDKEGKVIVPAAYYWITPPYEQGDAIAIGNKENESYWFINLHSGEEKQIYIEGAMVRYANLTGNNWCIVAYDKQLGEDIQENGVALLKNDLEYMFYAPDYGYTYVSGSHIRDDLFTINYSKYIENFTAAHTDIFDAARGVVIKSIPGYNYNYSIKDNMMMFTSYTGISRQLVLNYDFEPFFNTDAFGGEFIRFIHHLADDVYNVRTTFYSGLIKENGQWLIRIYANNID